jgi:tetratricopeptide (TPR) repeat protein
MALFLWAAAALGCATGGGTDAKEQDRVAQARTHHDIGVNHLTEGRTALAIRELRASAELNPDDRWTHLHLALAYRAKRRGDDALRHLQRALEIDPEFHEARLTLSGVFIEAGRYPDAVREASLLIEDPTFPAPWRAHSNLGLAQMELGQLVEARRNLLAALEYNERYWRACLILGILEAKEGNRVAALERFQQVLETSVGPLTRAEAEYRIAEIYIELGRRDEAVRHLTAATGHKPSGEWGRRSEKYLKLLR